MRAHMACGCLLDSLCRALPPAPARHAHRRTQPSHTLPAPTPAGALDMQRLNEWLSTLLQEKGADIYRSKGILNIAGSDDK